MKPKNLFPLFASLFIVVACLDIPETAYAAEKTFTVKPSLRKVTLTGFTRARNTITLSSEESGKCLRVKADIGDAIGEDGVFAVIDSTFIKLDLEKNMARQASLKSDVVFYKKEVGRYRDLLSRNAVAVSKLDGLNRSLSNAAQGLRALKIQEKVLRERLRRCTLRAPGGWMVTERHVEPGEWLAAGQKAARLGRFDLLMIPFALTPDEFQAVKNGATPVRFQLPDLGAEALGRMARVSPEFDPETRKINVDFEIRRGGFNFRGGIRAEMSIDLPDPGKVFLVPKSSLIKAYDEHFLLRPDGKRVKVFLHGAGPEDTLKVSSVAIGDGDAFMRFPKKRS